MKRSIIKFDFKNKRVYDEATGEEFFPSCFIDLCGYVNYIEGRGHHTYAQALLRRVLDGEPVITKMIEQMQKHR